MVDFSEEKSWEHEEAAEEQPIEEAVETKNEKRNRQKKKRDDAIRNSHRAARTPATPNNGGKAGAQWGRTGR